MEMRSMAIKVFYHICAIHHVMSILKENVMAMHVSGLYDAAEAIYCCLCGEPEVLPQVEAFLRTAGKKFVVHVVKPKDTTYERLTLGAMHDLLQPGDVALYLHSKGVTRPFEEIEDWARLLSYFVIKYHKEFVHALEHGYDIAGINHHNGGGRYPWHFSGNFWWVRADYYLSLPRSIAPDYYAPEFYVCQKAPKAYVKFQSGVAHCDHPYKFERYVDADA
jgi:hypothetical protein